MNKVTKIKRMLITMALSLTILATGTGAFARSDWKPMSFAIPGGSMSTECGSLMDSCADLIRVDMSEINGCCYNLNTLKGLFGSPYGPLGMPGSYEVVEDEGSGEMMGRSVTTNGNKTIINWKISYLNTVHTVPEFQVKKGNKIYCSFSYTTPNGNVYMGIADPWDRLTLKLCSGGVFSHTFTAGYTGGYHFVVANRGTKTITVKGYFRVNK